MSIQRIQKGKGTPQRARFRIRTILALAVAVGSLAGAGAASEPARPRERTLINDNWRFAKGDPTNIHSESLLYDVRPVARGEDQQERPAEATADPSERAAGTNRVLKPWILPTGNPFIKDPAKRFVRPDGDPGSDAACVQRDFDDSGWRVVNLPHDWAIEGPFNSGGVGGSMGRLPSPGVGWYRKKLRIPATEAGRRFFLEVDGAMSCAVVWLDGKLIGGWPYGYASWQLDLTPHIVPGGENQLAIRLDNPPDFSRWYPGAGLYRNVWLTRVEPIHVGQWGTYVTTPKVSAAAATIQMEVTVENDSASDAAVDVTTEIFALDGEGRIGGRSLARMHSAGVLIAAGDRAVVRDSTTIERPRLWGPPPHQEPNRYVAVTTIRQAGGVVDRYETRFGIRSIECRPDGLYVNGERIPIRGVNLHHDLGALGAAFNERAAERQLEILREMGCNAIRTAHNPPAPEFLELADRMGFLVVDEIFDAWVRRKTLFDFHLIFPEWHEQDLRAFIRRDRNHPSVILWSVGNEVGEQYTGEEGANLARKLIEMAREEDPSRLATASMNYAKPDSAFAAVMDVICLNYQGEGIRDTPEFANFQGIRTPPLYDAFHRMFPDRMIFSSESAAALSSRGVYLFPVADAISNPTRYGAGGDSRIRQVSAYELYTADFGSSADKVFAAQDRNPFVAGEFVWSGWDYLGEPTPYYASRSSYFGIIDLAGFRKDRFYLYQSRWRPEHRMVHILPHWTWPERVGQITPVHVFTSGDEVELFLNGQSLGRKKKGQYEYRLRWDDVVYQPGTLRAVAYRNGRRWATTETKTAGRPAKLRLSADRDEIRADGRDLSFVTVTVTDQAGLTCPRADNRVHFEIEGPGEIVATDNGDPTSFESFQSRDRKAFNGLCLVVVRARPGETGRIRLRATADGLKGETVLIRAR
ncbi:MAG TPA: glycoside hydrolase family 2 protein [Verrucomicrobia bacterium]|nr:glycoside hydrolase family 2 protein [Verrucomicrobiota bacterium]HOP97918.1 beta-galactosidase GalB [Verrucomicrobiota bacterium]HPZ99849.1 beta-galactosidase GalB [Phycisphaerae bacterium]